MKKKNEHQPHQIVVEGDVGKLVAYNKKGKAVVAVFDTTDLEKVEAFENWRAVWHTDFDCAYVESKDFKDGHAKRTSVASAILECSPNAPIRHLNGDVLDNRRANLEIYDVMGQPNDYVKDQCVVMTLRDRYGRGVGECVVDHEDFDLVIQSGHVWLKKKRASGQPYVVNQDGLLLAHLLLGVSEGYMSYENKNPLDNRRRNIKIEGKM